MSAGLPLSRRQVLAVGGLAGLAGLLPQSALATSAPQWRMVIDPTVPAAIAARAMAADLGLEASERGHDLAGLLYASGRHWLAPGTMLVGVTGHAGFVVASGMARERRLPRVTGWILDHAGPRALPGSGELPPALLALARTLPADGRAVLWLAPSA